MANYTPMIQQYLSIKAEYPDAFLFFRLGDFYEMFFEDAKKAAEELEIVLTSRDGGKERVPMCGVPYHSAETYIERLINKGYKVAICEQVEDPSQAKGVVRREVVRVITPGTVIEEQMLEEKENNFLVVLAGDGHRSALAACDLSTGECHITQLEGAEDLLDEAATFHPREVLISGALARDKAFVKQSSTRLGSVVTPVDRGRTPAARGDGAAAEGAVSGGLELAHIAGAHLGRGGSPFVSAPDAETDAAPSPPAAPLRCPQVHDAG